MVGGSLTRGASSSSCTRKKWYRYRKTGANVLKSCAAASDPGISQARDPRNPTPQQILVRLLPIRSRTHIRHQRHIELRNTCHQFRHGFLDQCEF
jgi:hypothetical protein